MEIILRAGSRTVGPAGAVRSARRRTWTNECDEVISVGGAVLSAPRHTCHDSVWQMTEYFLFGRTRGFLHAWKKQRRLFFCLSGFHAGISCLVWILVLDSCLLPCSTKAVKYKPSSHLCFTFGWMSRCGLSDRRWAWIKAKIKKYNSGRPLIIASAGGPL